MRNDSDLRVALPTKTASRQRNARHTTELRHPARPQTIREAVKKRPYPTDEPHPARHQHQHPRTEQEHRKVRWCYTPAPRKPPPESSFAARNKLRTIPPKTTA